MGLRVNGYPPDNTTITGQQLEQDYEDWKKRNIEYDRNRDGIDDRFQTDSQRGEEIDADGNGVPDEQEAYFGNDRNGNGIPDDQEQDELEAEF